MGTRLYPQTKDVAKLELLAEVPQGTHARLEEIKARHQHEIEDATKDGLHPADRNDLEYQQWKEISADLDLANLNSFLLYGWGKFQVPGFLNGVMRGDDGYIEPSGSIEGENAVYLLQCNGVNVTLDDIGGGVYWC